MTSAASTGYGIYENTFVNSSKLTPMITDANIEDHPVFAPEDSLIALRPKLPVLGIDWKNAPPIFDIPKAQSSLFESYLYIPCLLPSDFEIAILSTKLTKPMTILRGRTFIIVVVSRVIGFIKEGSPEGILPTTLTLSNFKK